MRYAEGTRVEVESSRGEITGILAKHGVVEMGWQTGPEGDRLMFKLKGRSYLFSIKKPTRAEIATMYPNNRDPDAKWWAEWRRRWRAQVLLIKAKMEFAEGEDTTVEREFMPYLIVKGGGTLAEWVESDKGNLLIGAGT
jgi:hypothetical protein